MCLSEKSKPNTEDRVAPSTSFAAIPVKAQIKTLGLSITPPAFLRSFSAKNEAHLSTEDFPDPEPEN